MAWGAAAEVRATSAIVVDSSFLTAFSLSYAHLGRGNACEADRSRCPNAFSSL
jgi:hypothetical protein